VPKPDTDIINEKKDAGGRSWLQMQRL